MPQHMDLEPEIYGLKLRSADWPVDTIQKQNWVKRYGFPIVPDFAATVHAVTGGTLPTAIGDLDVVDSTPSQEDALKAYIVISSVERAENILGGAITLLRSVHNPQTRHLIPPRR